MAEDFAALRARGGAERPPLRDGNAAGRNESRVAAQPRLWHANESYANREIHPAEPAGWSRDGVPG